MHGIAYGKFSAPAQVDANLASRIFNSETS